MIFTFLKTKIENHPNIKKIIWFVLLYLGGLIIVGTMVWLNHWLVSVLRFDPVILALLYYPKMLAYPAGIQKTIFKQSTKDLFSDVQKHDQ